MSAAQGVGPPLLSVVVVSKDEPSLAGTLDHLERVVEQDSGALGSIEIVVVDASAGRLDAIRAGHPSVRWIDFEQPPGARVTIAHQRNVGVLAATGEVIVFIDCGCTPEPEWLGLLVHPILSGEERMACGQTGATGIIDPHARGRKDRVDQRYLPECPTINLAFTRAVYLEVGPFDESFEYGSDIDFSWRAVHLGVRILYAPEAVVLHDWGTRRRQLRRAFGSGKGRARLYAKHVLSSGPQSIHKRRIEEHDLVPIAYTLFLLGLPVAAALRVRSYVLLLALPLWRARDDRPVETLLDHLAIAVGVLAGAFEITTEQRRAR